MAPLLPSTPHSKEGQPFIDTSGVWLASVMHSIGPKSWGKAKQLRFGIGHDNAHMELFKHARVVACVAGHNHTLWVQPFVFRQETNGSSFS
jgi:hypothetical protein